MVVNLAGVEVDAGELLGYLIEQPRLGEPVDLRGKLEALKDVANVRRELSDVCRQVLVDVVLVAHQRAHVEL